MADAGPRKKDETSSRAVAAAAPPAPVMQTMSHNSNVKLSIGAPDAVRTEIELTVTNKSAEEGRTALAALNAPAGAATSFAIDLLLKEGVDMFELGELCGVIKLGWAEGVVPKLPEAFVNDTEWMGAKGGLVIKPAKREDGRDILRLSTHFCANPASKLALATGTPMEEVQDEDTARLSLGFAIEQLSALRAPGMTLGQACRVVLEINTKMGAVSKARLRDALRKLSSGPSGPAQTFAMACCTLGAVLRTASFELAFENLEDLADTAFAANHDKEYVPSVDAIPTFFVSLFLGSILFQSDVPATLAQLRDQVLDKIVSIDAVTLQMPRTTSRLHLRNMDIMSLVPDEAWESIPPRERTAGNWQRMLDALAGRGCFNPALDGVSPHVMLSLIVLDALGGTAGQVSKEGPSAGARSAPRQLID
jgi:hypothetical protein